MNRFFSKIATLLVGSMMAIGVGVAIGSNPGFKEVIAALENVYTLTPYLVEEGGNSNYADFGNAIVDGVEWSIGGNTTVNPWKIGGKKTSDETVQTVSRSIYSIDCIEHQIDSITVSILKPSTNNIQSNAYYSATLYVSSQSNRGGTIYSTLVKDNTEFKEASSFTYTRPNEDTWENAYYTFVFSIGLGNKSTAKSFELESIRFDKTVSDISADSVFITTDSFSIAKTSIGNISDILDAKVYASDGITMASNQNVTWSAETEDVVILDNTNGTYNVIGSAGSTTRIFATSVDGNILSSNNITLTVVTNTSPYTLVPGQNGYSDSAETAPTVWTNNNTTKTVYYNGIVFSCAGSNTAGKYFTLGGWRLYQANSETLTITAPLNNKITSITFTFTTDNDGTLNTEFGDTLTSNEAWEIDSVTRMVSVVVSGSGTTGQVRISKIVVACEETEDPTIEITDLENHLSIGDEGSLSYSLTNATNPIIEWVSSNNDILEFVDDEYIVHKYGVVTVTANLLCEEGEASDTTTVIIDGGAIDIDEALLIAGELENGAKTDYYVTIAGYLTNLNPDPLNNDNKAINVSDKKVANLDTANTIMVYGVYSNAAVRNYIVLNGKISYRGRIQNYGGTIELTNISFISYTDDAISFAAQAYSLLSEACNTGVDAVDADDWAILADAWDDVDDYSKIKLQNATSDYAYDTNIKNWVRRYNIIAGARTDLVAFMTPNANEQSRISLLNDSQKIESATVIIISTLSLSAVALYFFFRRKEQ